MPTLSLWAATREVGVDALLGTSSLLIRKVGCWRVRQNDEPDRDHLGVTSERDIQGDPGSPGVGGWDQKTLSQRGLRLLWLGKAGEGQGVSDPTGSSFRRLTVRGPLEVTGVTAAGLVTA